ncbi:MAG: response regulator [Spongiibacteraceae bacterium]
MATIMVVEDNPTNMKLVHMVLDRGGYTVQEASGAEEAIASIRINPPDLVLMDVQLPGMDGFEAMALLKADPTTTAIPVVALTAFAMHGDEEKILEAGFDAYIAKPIRYNELLALVERFLVGKK